MNLIKDNNVEKFDGLSNEDELFLRKLSNSKI